MAIDQVKLLARLLEVTRSLSTVVDLETYLQSILSAATELTESETASLMEYDEATQEFFFRYVPWFHRDSGCPCPVEWKRGWVGVFTHQTACG